MLNGERFTVTDLRLGTVEKPLSITSAITSDASKLGFAGVDMIHKFWMQDAWKSGEVVEWGKQTLVRLFSEANST